MTDIMGLLGADADGLLQHVCKGIPRESLHLPGPDFVDRDRRAERPLAGGDAQPAAALRPRPARGNGLSFHPAGRPGHRAQRRRVVREEPAVLRPREHREARDRRRLQRGGLHARRARRVLAQVRAQDSVPAQVQPQRVPHLPQQVRPDLLRQHQAGEGHGRGGGGRDDLLRLGRVGPPDRRGEPGVRGRARDGHGHGAVVLSAQPGVQDATRTTTCRPTSPARPTISASRSRPTSSSRSCPRTTAATSRSTPRTIPYGKNDKRMYTELATDHPIDLARYQVANCYMGRAGLINSGGASGANDLADAVRTAVINKRAGGMGLISGRKAFQKPMDDGVTLLNAIQDVYLSPRASPSPDTKAKELPCSRSATARPRPPSSPTAAFAAPAFAQNTAQRHLPGAGRMVQRSPPSPSRRRPASRSR